MHLTAGPLLQAINSPDDLKKIPKEQLHQVCDELRQYIVDVVSVHGGHFAAMEEPELLAEDLRTWFRAFRAAPPQRQITTLAS